MNDFLKEIENRWHATSNFPLQRNRELIFCEAGNDEFYCVVSCIDELVRHFANCADTNCRFPVIDLASGSAAYATIPQSFKGVWLGTQQNGRDPVEEEQHPCSWSRVILPLFAVC